METETREQSPGSAEAPRDATDFETRLASRTKVPPERLAEFLAWSPDKLGREAERVSRVLKRFAEAVVRAMDDPGGAGEFLRDLDLQVISRDHDWRAIFSTIRAQSAGHDRHRRSVLVRYLQYLSFRKRLLEFIHSRKQGLEETDAFKDFTRYPAQPQRLDAPHPGASPAFARLAVGEPRSIELTAAGKADLMFGPHLFRLVGGSSPSLIDQNGVTYFVREGRNMIGRHPESDIVVDQDFGDVSRAHAILEWDGADGFALTDLSSRGTFVGADDPDTQS